MDTEWQSLRCDEPSEYVDTAWLLMQALTDVHSVSEDRSDVSHDEPLNKAKPLIPPTPSNIMQDVLDEKPEKRQCEVITYTEPSNTTPLRAACPAMRDPAKRGAVYVPSEVLRYLNQPPAVKLEKEALVKEKIQHTEQTLIKQEEQTISLREVIRQVPIRLSKFRDGETESSFYDDLLISDRFEPPLRDRFASMDRAMRSKFIGLKNSSTRVRQKLMEKKRTNYKEVAEELVEEIGLADAADKKSMMEADNLKRRVYDVLNVFEAVGLIVKDQKNVYWQGNVATQNASVNPLQDRIAHLKHKIEKKRRYLEQIKESYEAMSALVEKNSGSDDDSEIKIHLPFVMVHCPEEAQVDIKISNASKRVQLDFHGHEFNVSGDVWALKELGLHRRSDRDSVQNRFFQQLFADELLSLNKRSVLSFLNLSCQEIGVGVRPFIPEAFQEAFGDHASSDNCDFDDSAREDPLMGIDPPSVTQSRRKRQRGSSSDANM